jgi:hypothetical protein
MATYKLSSTQYEKLQAAMNNIQSILSSATVVDETPPGDFMLSPFVEENIMLHTRNAITRCFYHVVAPIEIKWISLSGGEKFASEGVLTNVSIGVSNFSNSDAPEDINSACIKLIEIVTNDGEVLYSHRFTDFAPQTVPIDFTMWKYLPNGSPVIRILAENTKRIKICSDFVQVRYGATIKEQEHMFKSGIYEDGLQVEAFNIKWNKTSGSYTVIKH